MGESAMRPTVDVVVPTEMNWPKSLTETARVGLVKLAFKKQKLLTGGNKMATSVKKIRANRENAQKSPGPIDTTSTRFNATKHALLALGITELDNAEGYRTIVRDLMREKNPTGILETKLVEAAALDIVRWARARRLEAEYITAALNPPRYEKDFLSDFDSKLQGAVLDPGIPAAIGAGNVQQLVNIFQRYESLFANRLFRTLHELERLQRIRQGERLPAPAAVDVSVRAETGALGSVAVGSEHAKVLPRDGESLPRSVIADIIHANTGVKDSALGELEQQRVPPADGEDFEAAATVDVVDGETLVSDSAPVAWKPRAPSGPIWNR